MKKVLRLFIVIFILTLAASFVLEKIEVKHKNLIDSVSAEYSLNEKLIYALIMTESNFDENAEFEIYFADGQVVAKGVKK